MFFRRRLSHSLVAALVLAAWLAPAAMAAEVVTVLLKGGEEYQDVTYRILSKFSVLEIKRGGTVTNLNFSEIQAIYDADGHDIAPELLGEGYRSLERAPGDTSPVKRRGRRRAAPWRTWNVVLSVDGRMDTPFGRYYDGSKGGAGFGGTIHVRVTPDLAFRGSVTRLGLGFGDDFGLVSYERDEQIISQDFDLDGLRFLAGVEYHKALGSQGPRWGFWYVHASVGAIRHSLKGEAVVFNPAASLTYRVAIEDSDTQFTQQHGVGVVYGISDRLGLVGSGELDLLWTDTPSWDDGASTGIKGFVLGGTIGLAVRL